LSQHSIAVARAVAPLPPVRPTLAEARRADIADDDRLPERFQAIAGATGSTAGPAVRGNCRVTVAAHHQPFTAWLG